MIASLSRCGSSSKARSSSKRSGSQASRASDASRSHARPENSRKREGRKRAKNKNKKKKKRKERSASSNSNSDAASKGQSNSGSRPKKRRRKKRHRKKEGSGKESEGEGKQNDSNSSDGSGKCLKKKGRRRRRRRKESRAVYHKTRRKEPAEEADEHQALDQKSNEPGEKKTQVDESRASRCSKGSKGSSSSESSPSSESKAAGKRRRRRRKRGNRRRRRRARSQSSSGSSGSRSRPGRRRRVSKGDGLDKRPMVERVKGGVKLFVGRLPMEATQSMLLDTFRGYGEVLEVFLIDGRGTSGARCAFVRMGSLQVAQRCVDEMHEHCVLVPERRELGPIQVAFAKGEAVRFGLDVAKEQLPARSWQLPMSAHLDGRAGMPPMQVDPDSMSKDALVSLIKEGQRTGGQAFKTAWWTYSDSGRGGVTDYDPKRHSQASLRQFASEANRGEWGARPWFRRAMHWAALGGRGGSRPRREGSYSSSYSSSSSASANSARLRQQERRKKATKLLEQYHGQAGISPATLAPVPGAGIPGVPYRVMASLSAPVVDLLRGKDVGSPPLPSEAPPPEPMEKPRLLASALEQAPDAALEAFLAKYRISPTTSFLMLKLHKQQAAMVLRMVEESLSHLSKVTRDAAEEVVLTRLKALGVRTSTGGGAWTSMERTASPQPMRMPRDHMNHLNSSTGLENDLELPSVEGLIGQSHVGSAGGEDAPIPADPDVANAVSEKDVNSSREDDKPAPQTENAQAQDDVLPPLPLPDPPGDSRVEPAGIKIFVKNLAKSTSATDIRDLFSKHGEVLDVEIPRDKETGQPKGKALVYLSNADEAQRAVKALNFTKPWGRALVVERKDLPCYSAQANAPAPEVVRQTRAHATKPRTRERPPGTRARAPSKSGSRSRSASSSGWSKYTVGSKAKRKGQSRGKKQKNGEKKRDQSSSSDYSSYDDSYYSEDSRRSQRSRKKDGRDRRQTVDAMRMWPRMSGMPGMPAGMPAGMPVMPGMPSMPGPYGMMPPGMIPPWGMPWAMPPVSGRGGYDADLAERMLEMAERRSKKEQHEREEKEKHMPWEDHPARLEQKMMKPTPGCSDSSSSESQPAKRPGTTANKSSQAAVGSKAAKTSKAASKGKTATKVAVMECDNDARQSGQEVNFDDL